MSNGSGDYESNRLGSEYDRLSNDQIARGWIALYEDDGDDEATKERKFWAYEAVDQFIRKQPNRGLDIILRVLELTSNEWVLTNTAAGPLEDLIARDGPAMIDRIERAAEDPRFAALLKGVWMNRSLPEIWARVEAVRKGPGDL